MMKFNLALLSLRNKMVQLTTEQRVFICVELPRVQRLCDMVFNKGFQIEINLHQVQFSGTPESIFNHAAAGTSLNLNKKHSGAGRRRTIQTVKNIDSLRTLPQKKSHVSNRLVATPFRFPGQAFNLKLNIIYTK